MINTSFFQAFERSLDNRNIPDHSQPTLAKHIISTIDAALIELGVTTTTRPLSCDGSLWIYDDRCWRRLEPDDITTMVLMLDGRWATPEADRVLQASPIITCKPHRIRLSYDTAMSVGKIILRLHEIRQPGYFDQDPPGLVCRDGYYRVSSTGIDRVDNDPDHRSQFAHPCSLEGDDVPHKWLDFLRSLWRDDADVQHKVHALQEWIGCALASRAPSFARCLLLVGRGANGKSCLMSAIEGLFPTEQVTSASPKRWDNDYALATLRDSRLNVCAELPEYNTLESSDSFKAILSGDRVTARMPYCPPFSFRPRAGHVFSCNALPHSSDSTPGFFRRFLILQFNRDFSGESKNDRRDAAEILVELEEERAAILMWALHGAARLLRRGEFTLPASHGETIDEWHLDNNPVNDFVTSCCDTERGETSLSVLHSDYLEWAAGVQRRPMTNRSLAKKLRALGIKSRRTADGNFFSVSVKMKAEWVDYQ